MSRKITEYKKRLIIANPTTRASKSAVSPNIQAMLDAKQKSTYFNSGKASAIIECGTKENYA